MDEKQVMQGYKHPPKSEHGLLGISRPPSLPNQVSKRIVDAIDEGTFQPGERLVETRLAEMFCVSRGPIREALKALESENIVIIKPGRGTFVASPSCDDIEQIIAVRAVLEGLAARTVAAKRDQLELTQLKLLCKRMCEAVKREDISGYQQLDWRIHELVFQLSENRLTMQSWQSMRCQLHLYWRGRISNLALIEKLARQTCVLVRCLCEDEPNEVGDIFRSHTILSSYEIMVRPIPELLKSYITHMIDGDGQIHRLQDQSVLAEAMNRKSATR